MDQSEHRLQSDSETEGLGQRLAKSLKAGDVVLLHGVLGAGKTTLVRGLLRALGHEGPVKSPTFNIVQSFETTPPVVHIDLYRVKTHQGLGIEDYLASHLVLIEWPDRAAGLIDPDACWQVTLVIEGNGRKATVTPPAR